MAKAELKIIHVHQKSHHWIKIYAAKHNMTMVEVIDMLIENTEKLEQ